jgi:hypothetical protein
MEPTSSSVVETTQAMAVRVFATIAGKINTDTPAADFAILSRSLVDAAQVMFILKEVNAS